ncbi:MAG: hypothetical protein PVF17_12330 [Ignavibacteria bacterium]|jgi:hypothetical protein
MLIRIVLSQILLSIIILFSFNGCDDTFTAADIDSRIIPESNVSYSKDLAPVFELKCVGCHGPSKTEGGLNLSSWTYIVSPGLVTPGDEDASPIIWYIERQPGFEMPPLDTPIRPFTLDQIRGVKTWIDEGALNN